MQLSGADGESRVDNSRLLTWIDALELCAPKVQQLKDKNSGHKRPCGHLDSIISPSKRGTLSRPRQARALAPISGNIMDSRRRSPRRQTPSTPSKPVKEGALALDEADEETPRPTGSVHSALQNLQVDGVSTAVRLPPPLFNAQESVPSPSRSSSTDGSSELSEGLSSARSTSPTKHLVDLRTAERPTLYEDLDGAVARKASGVLSQYKDLVAVSRGQAVIPQSLKV